MLKWKFRTIVAAFLLVVLSSCNKEDVSGQVDGVWQTEWDDVLDGDLDALRVTEILVFESTNQAGSEGVFVQIFTGDVDFDDWENESNVKYEVSISGNWEVVDKDNIRLKYDLHTMSSSFGKSDVELDYTDAAISLLQGDWSGLLVNAAMAGDADKINTKIEAEVERQINQYFREMFHEIIKDKKALTDVKIEDDLMTCVVNHGFFGREQTYDRVEKGLKFGNGNVTEVAQPTKVAYEGDELDGLLDTYSLNGMIGGKYPFEMEISVLEMDLVKNARYRYTKTGSGSWIDLEIDVDELGQTIMYEKINGKRVGRFEARLTCTENTAEIKGWHKNFEIGNDLTFYANGVKKQ